MKNQNTFFICMNLLLFSTGLFAQPTITNQNMVEVGSSAPVQYFEQAVFSPGPAGPNQNWDFSQVMTKGTSFEWKALSPVATPWAADYPTATHAFPFLEDSIEGMHYYRYDGSRVELLGTVNALHNNGSTDTLLYDFNANPQLEMAYPLSYQGEVKDTASGTATISFAGNTVTVNRTIYRTLRADGHGDLTTPFGSFSNVLRVIIEEDIEDRTFGQIVTRQANRRYYWYAPNEKYLLLQMDSLAVLPLAGPSSVSFNMFYRSGEVMTGIDKNIATDIGLTVFPNPAHEQIHIRLQLARPEQIQLEIRDLQGRLIRQLDAFSTDPISLLTMDITPGIFLLIVKTQEGKATQLITLK